MDSSAATPLLPPPTRRTLILQRALAGLVLAGAGALGANTIRSALRSDSVLPPNPNLPPIAEAAEATARQQEIAGTYATGNQSGDRLIVIHVDGRVEFSELGANEVVNGDADTFQLRRRAKQFALLTPQHGVIDVLDVDRVSYWRDVYRRK